MWTIREIDQHHGIWTVEGFTVHPAAIIVIVMFLQSFFFVSLFTMPHAQADSGEFDPMRLERVWEYTKKDNEATFWKLAWSPDGSMVAATFFDNSCTILDASNGSVIKALDLNDPSEGTRCDGFSPQGTTPLRACAFSPDGSYLAVAGDDLKIHLLNTTSWETDHTFIGHSGSILCLDFSPDGQFLASGSGTDKVIPQNAGENVTRIWNIETRLLEHTLRGHLDGVLGVEWSHTGNEIATVSDDRSVKIWSFPSGQLIRNLTGHTSGVLDVDWSPDDTTIITGSRDYKVKVWNSSSGSLVGTWSDNNCVRSVDFHPLEELAATSGVDQTLKIRDSRTGTPLRILKDGIARSAMVMCSRWSPDGKNLVSGLGKSHSVIMYRFGSERKSDENGWIDTGLQTVIVLVVVSVIFLYALYHPVVKRIRNRRS